MAEPSASDAPNEDAGSVIGIPPADKRAFAASLGSPEPYALGPDSLPQDGVPRGVLTQHRWDNSTVYPGTGRDYWLYVPQQYDAAQPAPLMVFQDAALYLGPDVNAPVVLDNLIRQGAMPPTIGLFVSPGDRGPGMPIYGGADNRSLEYDSLYPPPERQHPHHLRPRPAPCAARGMCATILPPGDAG